MFSLLRRFGITHCFNLRRVTEFSIHLTLALSPWMLRQHLQLPCIMNHTNVPHQDANVSPQALLRNGNVLAIKQAILSWFCYDISHIGQKVRACCVFLCRRRVREIPWLQRHVIGLLSNDPANDPQCWQHCNNTGGNSNEETSLISVEYYKICNV